jgi:hypothetical protein
VIWSDIFLGVIAAATSAIAIVLVTFIVTARRVALQIGRLLEQLEGEVRPLFGHLDAFGRDAARAAALASAQMERIDHVLNELTLRADQAVHSLQDTLAAPAREGRAIWSALLAALRTARGGASRRPRSDEEDALFI